MSEKPDLSVDISGLTFKNPVITASGTFGYGVEFSPFFDLSLLGGICTKGLSLEPRPGNNPGRIIETPAGMLNAIGLENVGIESFITDKLPKLEPFTCHVIANILGKSIDEFVAMTEKLNTCEKVSAYEINISCPNVAEGGIQFSQDPEMAARVTRAVKQASSKPVWIKLSPNVTDITLFARACEEAGADALTMVNTFVGMSIDVKKRRPMLSNVIGGLSGPAIRPLAVRMVYQASRAVSIPIIGIGGIVTARDALEFMIAGAAAVQVGTANFIDPLASVNIINGLKEFCLEQGITDINELVGSLELPGPEGFLYY
ncbi:MAG: dihydroorotate dehydrogenase [Acidobacteriota bacterium]